MPGVNKFILPLLSSPLFLVDDFGLQSWVRYRSELEQAGAGIPYSELGIGERRQSSMPRTFSASGEMSAGVTTALPDSIAIISNTGIMQDEGGMSTRGASDIEADFRQAYSNPDISAIIFDNNSGGGMASAGWRLNSVIKERNKPVLAFARYMGSAAYLAAVASDEIMAPAGSEIGSIGAYIPIDKVMMEMLAADIEFVYADQSMQKNGAFMAALKGDYGPLRAQATKIAAAFIKEVEDQRTLTESYKEQVLSGLMFTARDAKKRGLIDSQGTLTDAMNRAGMLGKRYKKTKNAK